MGQWSVIKAHVNANSNRIILVQIKRRTMQTKASFTQYTEVEKYGGWRDYTTKVNGNDGRIMFM